MNDLPPRPNPDLLLRRLKDEEVRAKRGKLKLFFGFAPGVGKTYRMLQVARDLVSDSGMDVVVGIVEDHKRSETAKMVLGLELLPRRKLEYRGRVLEEFDLDRALARKPKLILIDEFAHSNAAGSRHPKRWQDVEELLDAGIDVFSTLNVQHIESLNDIVAQITGVRVRETIPDSVLDRANEIELVDIAPEELLARLGEGKVYLGDQAKRAAEHFFKRGNLLALRELALRRTAQHVDEDVLAYREQHGVATTWPSGERLVVCVGPSPTSGRLIRAAARMAAGLRCPWIATTVDTTTSRPLDKASEERLETHLRLAESLGATVQRLSGATVSDALLDFSRKHNVTRLVIGKPTHSRLRDRLRGSLLDEIVRGSGDIDVHVISGDDDPRVKEVPSKTGENADFREYLGSVGLVLGTLVIGLVLRRLTNLPDLEMLFLLAVMISALWFGRGPSILTATLGVACYDFFFVPPFHTFSIEDRRYFLTFAMMFGVGFVMSELTRRLKHGERDARSREARTLVLYALTKELSATDVPSEIAAIATRHASEVFSAKAFVLGLDERSEFVPLAAAPEGETLDAKELGVAKWSHERDAPSGLGTDTLPGAKSLCFPLRIGSSRLGILALVPRNGAPFRIEQRSFLAVFASQLAVALERARLSETSRQSALRAKTEEMRSSLLSAVSHDLRTPLATITGAATVLRDETALENETRGDLVDSIVDQAERLERLVANLLEMTRLDSGGIALKKDWVPLDEIIGATLTQLEKRLENRSVEVKISEAVPLLHVDPVLFQQIFVNLLENADKYTPPGTLIRIDAKREDAWVAIEVSDDGPGLPPGSESQIFEKFFRGSHGRVGGAGLGLAICKGIAEAHGGTIVAETKPAGGASFRVSIPVEGTPPNVASEKELS